MLLKWLPWKYLIRRLVVARGFLNPFSILEKLERFAQRSEVSVPVELLRAGVAFHARGLLNTKAIQTNLDWIWPYWVRKQFDPKDESFLPRAFSATHVNLTHRNWTAVGLPGLDAYPLVDPRGMVTPLYDGWSLDAWIMKDDGDALYPSQTDACRQWQTLENETLRVQTGLTGRGVSLDSTCTVVLRDGKPVVRMKWTGTADAPARLMISLRPLNPEGVSMIGAIAWQPETVAFRVDDHTTVAFEPKPERAVCSTYRDGDVNTRLRDEGPDALPDRAECPVGLATGAAVFRMTPGQDLTVCAEVPLDGEHPNTLLDTPARPETSNIMSWTDAVRHTATLECPDERFVELYEAALHTLVLLSPGDVYPGPYTYRRFWYRDAAFMIHALLGAGLTERARVALESFPYRQTMRGYFKSQDGEWDSNGEAIWILARYSALTNTPPPERWLSAVQSGAEWILRKRCVKDGSPHAGLMPAGFSAEHFGNNDYYYWDDFWSIAGLRAAARLARQTGDTTRAAAFDEEADDFVHCVEASLKTNPLRQTDPALPASPYRRMDAGAVGSLVAGYPLDIYEPDDPRLLGTAKFLRDRCFVDGVFFQDMIHSGLNAYLSLHVAQVLLRADDPAFWPIVKRVAAIASPTGHWPEAVHPRTGGGCMGDGQHGWAAAEWVMMLRNMFVREEDGRLILGSGIPPAWLESGKPLSFGPTPTPWGPVTVRIRSDHDVASVSWESNWHADAPVIEIRLAGGEPRVIEDDTIRSQAIVWKPDAYGQKKRKSEK